MGNHASTIEVERPISTVYNQWTQFESFPKFMEGVESVTQLDNSRLHWVVDIAGVEREFDAEITQQLPDEQIAWVTTDGPYQAGMVSFEPVSPERTKVTMNLAFEPEGFTEKAGDALGFVSNRMRGDLDRFKKYVEDRGADGAWRGTIS